MPYLMAEADYLDKLWAICTICGDLASYSQRITSDTGRIVIGELDKYASKVPLLLY